jgi:type II secretory pathway pseudopilin PulG
MTRFHNKKIILEKSFTLVELLVAVSLFVIVMSMSLGSVVSVLDAGRKSQSLKSVLTNVNLTMEAMARDIKFGSNYYCYDGFTALSSPFFPNNCPSGDGAVAFIDNDGNEVRYRFNSSLNRIQKSVDFGASWVALTLPPYVIIDDMKFYVTGAGPQATPPQFQPRVVILIRGNAGSKLNSQSSFILQTMVSQRALDS